MPHGLGKVERKGVHQKIYDRKGKNEEKKLLASSPGPAQLPTDEVAMDTKGKQMIRGKRKLNIEFTKVAKR